MMSFVRILAAPRNAFAFALLLASPIAMVAAEPPSGSPQTGLSMAGFGPRSGPRGQTLFTLLPSERTGVVTENQYADPQMKGALFQQYNGGSIGTGVAIGDFDNDGRPDLFVVSKTESCRLFRNRGDFKFEDVTERAGVADKGPAAAIWKFGVTFVDINNDGWLDLYICRFDEPNLLYINQGNGTFQEQAQAYGLDVKDSSVMAAFADYDRDGRLDMYLATNMLGTGQGSTGGRRGYLFHQESNGHFANVTDRAGITLLTRSHSATWWDYDGDGWPDLYTAYDYGVPDSLYHNNRDGSFTDVSGQVLPHTSFSSMGSDYGDVNNDGRIDFIVADMASAGHEKDQRMMADSRARLVDRPDESTTVEKLPRNALLINTGTAHFQEAAFLAGVAETDWTWSIRFVDLDNDGRLDLHVTNGFPYDPSVDVVKRQMAAESTKELIRIMTESPTRAEKDIALRNAGDLRFEDVSAAWGLDQLGVSFGASFGDLDGDGDLDLVFSNYHAGVTVLRNDGQQGHSATIAFRGSASNHFGVGATVRVESAQGVQVSTLGLSRGYLSTSEPALHFGFGEDEEISRLDVTWPSGLHQSWSHLPVDRNFTLTEADAPPSGTAELRGGVTAPAGQFAEVSGRLGLTGIAREDRVNEASLQRLVPFRFERRGPGLAVGRLGNSPAEALVMGGTALDPARVVTPAPGQALLGETRSAVPASLPDGPVLVFDVNADGRDDVLITKGGNRLPAGMPDYQPQLLVSDAGGQLRPVTDALPALPINAGCAVAADFNRDGLLDVFIGGRVSSGQYPLPAQSALLLNRRGKFEDVTESVSPGLGEIGMVTSALWSDVDGDGWVDLMLALDWGAVKYYHNREGVTLEDWSERAGFATAGTGWWTSIASADFNEDGRPDFVVGNVGLNTQYRANPDHPALLYAGDFKGSGSLDLIEAYFEGDRIYPWRARRDLAAVFPFIMKKFPANNDYASASVGEIFGEAKLAQGQRFEASELRSGTFLSGNDGTYVFHPLPRIAQIAPLQGVVAGDFDGDGHADVYAVQNSYAPVAAVGRFDGGISQLLRGDGRGGFEAVLPAESGLDVAGDAKALVVWDNNDDGWPDFVVSRNNGTPLAFENRGVPGRASLRVALVGRAGNPRAIGARVRFQRPDGSASTAELQAGGGYASQSSASCFFGYEEGTEGACRIFVRWPWGETTEHAVPTGVSNLTIAAPSGQNAEKPN